MNQHAFDRRQCLLTLMAGMTALRSVSSFADDAAENSGRKLTALDPDTRRAIDKGFAWLKSGLRRDGMMGTDAFRSSEPDLSSTAITGLAFLATGSTPNAGRFSKECRSILYGVLELLNFRPLNNGRLLETALVQRKIGLNADLFLATLFLTQVYYEASGDEKAIRSALTKLVEHICQTQGPDGTWGNESWAPVLGTVLGWSSLRSAAAAGFEIKASSRLVGEALIKKLGENTDRDQNWMFRLYKDASSLRALYSLDDYRDTPLFRQTLERLFSMVREDSRVFLDAGGEEYLAFFLVTECLLKEPRPDWQKWYPLVRDQLLRRQNGDGSWEGHHCIVERTFCTAAALLTLLAPERVLITSEL